LVDDWRYRSEKDKIKTLFFTAERLFGIARASDDIEELKCFDLDKLTEDDIVDTHLPLWDMLKNHINNKNNK